MIPNINYADVQGSYSINTPLLITPNSTGGTPQTTLNVKTISGATNNMVYPVDGTTNEATYKLPISVTVKADGTLAAVDDMGPIVRVITPQGVSSTIAGKYEVVNGRIILGYVDAKGSSAKFKKLKGVAFDKNGNILVADNTNSRLRKVDVQGNVTTVAGSGFFDIADGNGINASFLSLRCLWVDNAGNVFATDDATVRKITPNGDVTTIAGSVLKGNVNGQGVNAKFKTLRGITGDNSGNLYVTDPDNQSIRKIDANGNVTTLATGITGAGIAIFNNVLYVADWMKNQIKNVDTTTGAIIVYAGNGVGACEDGPDTRGQFGASFYNPEGVAIDSVGNVYVADRSSQKIRKVEKSPAFAVNPALPTGLKLNADTGIISGTPTQKTPLTTYTVTGSNYDGSSTANISINIQ